MAENKPIQESDSTTVTSSDEGLVSPQQEQSWLNDLDRVDKLMEEEDIKNAKYRKRMLFLIPFNFFCLYATIKYFQNIQRIAKKYWPRRQKATLLNFFLVGTAQAMVFTTFYLGGTIAILGINPIAVWKKREMLVSGPSDEELQQDEQQIQKAVEGMNMSDAVVLRMFKAMGLSDKTMVQIEKDLRNQQVEAAKTEKFEKEITK